MIASLQPGQPLLVCKAPPYGSATGWKAQFQVLYHPILRLETALTVAENP